MILEGWFWINDFGLFLLKNSIFILKNLIDFVYIYNFVYINNNMVSFFSNFIFNFDVVEITINEINCSSFFTNSGLSYID